MPQIPVYNPGQRMEPSSPVAVASSEGAAGNMMADATQRLGGAIFGLGNKLDEVARRAKEQSDRLTAKTVAEEYEQQLLMIKAKADAAPTVWGDSSGAGATSTFMTEARELKEKYKGTFPDAPELAKEFDMYATQTITQFSTQRLASEVEKRAKNIPIQKQALMATYESSAFTDYRQTPNLQKKAEIAILEDEDIAPKDKPTAILKMNTSMVGSGTMGLLEKAKIIPFDKSENAHAIFNEARLFVKANLPLMSEEGRVKMLETIDREQKQYSDTAWSVSQQTDALLAKRAKGEHEATMQMFSRELQLAGNNDLAFQDVMSRAAKSRIIQPEDLSKLTSMGSAYAQTKDDQYQKFFMDKLIAGKITSAQAEKQLMQDSGLSKDAKVSSDRATKLQKAVSDFKEHTGRNPEIQATIRSTEEYIKKTYGMTLKADPLNPDGPKIEVFSVAGAKAVQDFHANLASRVARGEILTPGVIIAVGNRKLNGPAQDNITYLPPDMARDPNLQIKAKDDIAKKFKENSKSMTTKQKIEMLNTLKNLNKNIDETHKYKQNTIERQSPYKNGPLRSSDE